jgi:uncharacterized protein
MVTESASPARRPRVLRPDGASVMIKPVGASCNLDCVYCYYLPTSQLFGGHQRRMSPGTLERVFAGLLPGFEDQVNIVWQGGEPTLAGLDFFRHAIELQRRYARPGQRVSHALQTNCTLLDDEWCAFLREHRFLVGASVDGPPRFHDAYRVTTRGRASSGAVLRGIAGLREHGVEFNILCVINDRNVHHPGELWRFLLSLGSPWIQFIPAIEWEDDPGSPGRRRLAPYSPGAADFGRFLCAVFDRWFDRARERVSVRLFDAVLNKLVLDVMPLCILDGSCHNQLTVEHDGSVFGCDHFVERRWQLGSVDDPGGRGRGGPGGSEDVGLTVNGVGVPCDRSPGVRSDWLRAIDVDRLESFAARKSNLARGCVSCKYRAFCFGGCPKHRERSGGVPEPTVLCEAYRMFYGYALPRLRWLASFFERGEQPPAAR